MQSGRIIILCCHTFHAKHQNKLLDSILAIVHNNFFHLLDITVGCWCAEASRAVIYNVFPTLFNIFVPLVKSCYTHTRLAKSNTQHFKCSAELYCIFKPNLLEILWSILNAKKNVNKIVEYINTRTTFLIFNNTLII